LSRILGDRSDSSLQSVRRRVSEIVLVCGGGKSLADELSSVAITWPVVAADSATTVILESGITPDIIVTDLDGVVEDQIECNSRGIPVLVHAHGDNRKSIARYAPVFEGPIVGTCQCSAPPHIFNFGGFTDGDRAACICSELGSKKILLAGFDFENPTQKPGKSSDIKKRKLAWAKRILGALGEDGIEVIPVTEFRDR
jgi:2-amino-4-hydroxy-6-hydroxymethyldihydropteridine diphosphokinase